MDQLSELSSAPLYFIIFTGLMSGLAGSLHCTGMCGGLVTAITTSKLEIGFYHIGRLLGYITIGVLLPFLGFEFIDIKDNIYVSVVVALTLGGAFIYIGLKGLFNWKLSFNFHRILESINQTIYKGIFKYFARIGLLKSFAVGTSSALLPCGLLWTVIFLSMSAINIWYSLTFILFFWLGTVPALSFAPLMVNKILKPMQTKSPKLVPIVFLTIGIATITYRMYGLYGSLNGENPCH